MTDTAQVLKNHKIEWIIVNGIAENALSFHGRELIQLGLLCLIATPVARVFFSIIAFAKQRDTLYAIVAAFVLILLAHSLL